MTRWLFLVAILPPVAMAQADSFRLADARTVVFFGDSITADGRYVAMMETYLGLRHGFDRVRVINAGASSETISGTSEPDHDPPRPNAHDRFERDVVAYRPDWIIACFGMNDGNYHPPDPVRFQKYQEGVQRLISRAKSETQAKLALSSPPPFDPYRRQASDTKAKSFGYKFPAVNYDQTLDMFTRWLVQCDLPGGAILDVHTSLNAYVAERRKGDVSFGITTDGFHPDDTGHTLIAMDMLRQLGASPLGESATIDANAETSSSENVSELKWDGDRLAFTWACPIPLVHGPNVDTRIVQYAGWSSISRLGLSIKNLMPGSYSLWVEGTKVSDSQPMASWDHGVDLTAFSAWPATQRGLELKNLVTDRRGRISKAWREAVVLKKTSSNSPAETEKAEKATADAASRICELSRPVVVHAVLRVDEKQSR